jgi:hypothetical protein
MQLRLTDWVFAFVHGFRYEASKLKPEETKCFEPHVREQMLTKPIQAEALEFSKPNRIVMLFFFDQTKQDLLIRTRQERWDSLNATVTRLLSKYSTLQLKNRDLHRLLERCRCYPNKPDFLYAINFNKSVTSICLTNIRGRALPFSRTSSCVSEAQERAQYIFWLNHSQAQDESFSRTFFA